MPITVSEWKDVVQLFWSRVDQKTSWGKNELLLLWQECFVEVTTREDV